MNGDLFFAAFLTFSLAVSSHCCCHILLSLFTSRHIFLLADAGGLVVLTDLLTVGQWLPTGRVLATELSSWLVSGLPSWLVSYLLSWLVSCLVMVFPGVRGIAGS